MPATATAPKKGITRTRFNSATRRLQQRKSEMDAAERAMNQEIAAIRERYDAASMEAEIADAIAEADKVVTRLRTFYNRDEEIVETYAREHKDELLGKGKTADLDVVTIAFKSGRASVQYDRKEEEALVARIRQLLGTRFIRVSETVDKQAFLKEPERAAEIDGLDIVVGEETITITPKPLEA